MRYQFCVLEISDIVWQDILDSDDGNEGNQHLNHWGERGWDIQCVVPKLENGTTVGYAVVFKKPIPEGKEAEGCGK